LAVSLDQNARLELENIVSLILDECQYDHTLKADVLQGCLKIIIAYFTRLADISDTKTTSTHDQILFNAFMAKVEEQFYLRKMVSDYASELAVSPNYLSEVVRRVTGHSAGYHIRQRVLSEAKRMALNTATAVKQIAFELGFEDASTFSKFFKAEAGVNFTEFRSRHFG
jgi:AraC-like DNA-binding protein